MHQAGSQFFPSRNMGLPYTNMIALCLRYGWPPPLTPSRCVYNKRFTLEHILSCPHGGFPSIRHNKIRNITAHLMSEVCHNVGIEPPLQPLSGETMSYQSANSTDGARLDVKAQGFWGCETQCAFFDVKVFNHLHSHITTPLLPIATEKMNKKSDGHMIRKSEKLNMVVSPPLSSQCLEVWDHLLQLYTRDWLL